jgi:hypothetical protein
MILWTRINCHLPPLLLIFKIQQKGCGERPFRYIRLRERGQLVHLQIEERVSPPPRSQKNLEELNLSLLPSFLPSFPAAAAAALLCSSLYRDLRLRLHSRYVTTHEGPSNSTRLAFDLGTHSSTIWAQRCLTSVIRWVQRSNMPF